jgi:hypothetical protein
MAVWLFYVNHHTIMWGAAQQSGIYDQDWSHATPTLTSFRTWCETVLAPAAR